MSVNYSTPAAKPSKPYPDFPLTAHPAGYWCKKTRGKFSDFGPRPYSRPLFTSLDRAKKGDGWWSTSVVYQSVRRLGAAVGPKTRPHALILVVGVRGLLALAALDALQPQGARLNLVWQDS